jgi:hypothetical protein
MRQVFWRPPALRDWLLLGAVVSAWAALVAVILLH